MQESLIEILPYVIVIIVILLIVFWLKKSIGCLIKAVIAAVLIAIAALIYFAEPATSSHDTIDDDEPTSTKQVMGKPSDMHSNKSNR